MSRPASSVSGGTRFLCASCDYCGVELVIPKPAGIEVEVLSFEELVVEQVLEEGRQMKERVLAKMRALKEPT